MTGQVAIPVAIIPAVVQRQRQCAAGGAARRSTGPVHTDAAGPSNPEQHHRPAGPARGAGTKPSRMRGQCPPTEDRRDLRGRGGARGPQLRHRRLAVCPCRRSDATGAKPTLPSGCGSGFPDFDNGSCTKHRGVMRKCQMRCKTSLVAPGGWFPTSSATAVMVRPDTRTARTPKAGSGAHPTETSPHKSSSQDCPITTVW